MQKIKTTVEQLKFNISKGYIEDIKKAFIYTRHKKRISPKKSFFLNHLHTEIIDKSFHIC